jgi:dolichyl-phosphate beta-glucosyltransferase
VTPDVVVIVPCYNESQRLPVRQFHAFAKASARTEFLFVDDGSTDGTGGLLEAMKAEEPKFRVLRLPENAGKAEAVRQGVLASCDGGARLVAYWDADLATPLEVLPAFVRAFEDRPHLEMVLGSRVKLMGWQIERRALRHYLGRVFATLASLTLGLAIYDTQCGAKMFRVGDTLREMFRQPFLSRWIFDVELLARFLQIRKRQESVPAVDQCIYELPLPAWKDVDGSKVKPQAFLMALFELLRIRRTYRPYRML